MISKELDHSGYVLHRPCYKINIVLALKAGFHLCEFDRAIVRPVVWACVVCFNDEDSPVIDDRATDFGSWIDFNFFAISKSRANQIALILQSLLNTHAQGLGRAVARLVRATAFERSHGSRDHIRTSGNRPLRCKSMRFLVSSRIRVMGNSIKLPYPKDQYDKFDVIDLKDFFACL